MKAERSIVLMITCLCALVLLAAFPGMPPAGNAQDDQIVVGGKNFTEQYILANLAKMVLEDNGFTATTQTGVGTAVARRALLNDQIDLYYEYTGTAYTVFYKKSDRDIMTDAQRVYQWVKRRDAEKGLVWLDAVKFNNTYTLMMRKKQAEKIGIQTISDLAGYIDRHPGELVVGVDAEFWERPDGFKPLMRHYDFRVAYGKVKKMDAGLVYKALRDGSVDVSMGFATDGRIDAFGFLILEDDKSFFPVYSPAPVVRKKIIEKYPQIENLLAPIAGSLDTAQMRQLNAAVDVQHEEVQTVAENWLQEQGILK